MPYSRWLGPGLFDLFVDNRVMSQHKSEFKYIDLFAGCGGLSLGLEQQGGELICAVEKSPMAAETFYHNLVTQLEDAHAWTQYLALDSPTQVKRKLLVSEVSELLKLEESLGHFSEKGIDLIAGGPPCQGFSLAGKRNPDDARNVLPWQFLEVVSKVAPKTVVIENVVGMRHKFAAGDSLSTYDSLALALKETSVEVGGKTESYLVQKVQANALHYGAAQTRPRLLLIGVRTDVARSKAITATDEIWFSNFLDLVSEIPPLAPKPTVFSDQAATVRDALVTDARSSDSNYMKVLRNSVFWRIEKKGGSKNIGLRTHNAKSKLRFSLYLLVAQSRLSPILLKDPQDSVQVLRRDNALEELENLRYPVKLPGLALKVASKEALVLLLNEHKTRKHSQRVVALDKPAPTIVTAADDYIHPIEPRVFSVRELARFQGFPEDFEFRAKETTGGLKRRSEVPQYSQVGNAISPFLGIAIGEMIKEVTCK
jgi:DNA (cytosine-5)-methyltransferase 1